AAKRTAWCSRIRGLGIRTSCWRNATCASRIALTWALIASSDIATASFCPSKAIFIHSTRLDIPSCKGHWRAVLAAAVHLHPLDLAIFVAYFVGIVAQGMWLARREKATSRDYFLASDRLPWYAIGGSVLASNISSEHFVGMVGWAYTCGLVIANFEW